MKLSNIIHLLESRAVCGNQSFDTEITHAFASDLMSDVLTLQSNRFILLTGLVNLQIIRTAEMADITNIILVRNKKASTEILELANESNITIIECPFSMFKACGLLYHAGIKPLY